MSAPDESAPGATADTTERHAAIARDLDWARVNAEPIRPASDHGPLSRRDAYAVQRVGHGLRVARQEWTVGWILAAPGATLRCFAGAECGRLTDAMSVADGEELALDGAATVSPHVAVLLRRRLSGTVTLLEAGAAVEAVAPAIAVSQSRYLPGIDVTRADAIADNVAAAGFVVGPWHKPGSDLSNLGLILSLNGRAVEHGSTAAVLGDPLRALVVLARIAGADDLAITPGEIVLTGASSREARVGAGEHAGVQMRVLGQAGFAFVAGRSNPR